jgi:hypothetical protein
MVAIAAVSLAACGSSNKSVGGTASVHSQFLAFAERMRSHGLTSFPDPVRAGSGLPSENTLVIDGYAFTLGPGANMSSPAFQQAMTACQPRGIGKR